MIEPTDDERRNGWTAATLTAYVQERQAAHNGVVAFDPEFRGPPRPVAANSKYNPLRAWR